ncbi:MAG: aquaporin, partial [Planctomycetes bacterium]|nr:aquaporin [Planctomycetota bacterium]
MSDDLHPSDSALGVAVETGTGALRLDLARRLAAEAMGTALLIVAVIGSGIAASRLSSADVGLQLLENAAATAGALIGLILMFGAVSGAHFNPVVSLLDRMLGTTTTRDTGLYIVAQVVGGCLGAVLANVMFELPAVELSTTERSSPALWLSEVVATVALLSLRDSIALLALALLLELLVEYVVAMWVARRSYPQARFGIAGREPDTMREILRYGVLALLMSIGGRLAFKTDALV